MNAAPTVYVPYVTHTQGGEWVFEYDALKLSVGVEGIVERAGYLWAEFHFDDTESAKTIHFARVNLLDNDKIEAEARRLERKAKETEWSGLPWGLLLDQMTFRVRNDYRTGSPFVVLRPTPITALGSTYLWRPLLVKGKTTIIHAGGGTGKSWMALTLAACLATGMRFPGCGDPPSPCRVLYLDWEEDEAEASERYTAILAGLGITSAPDNLIYRRMHRPLARDIATTRLFVEQEGIACTMLDSLSFACDGKLTDDDTAERFGQAMRTLNCAKIALAHQTKADAGNREHRATPFGSAFFVNGARSVWELAKADEGAVTVQDDCTTITDYELGLYHQKVNKGRIHGNMGYRMSVHEDNEGNALSIRFGFHDIQRDRNLMGKMTRPQQIRALLLDGAKTARQLSEEIGISEGNIRANISRMSGIVTIDRSGMTLYGLAG